MTRQYKTFEHASDSNRIAIKFTDGDFSNILFSYGKSEFEEKDTGECILHFEYDIIEGTIPQELYPKFQSEIGDFLLELLEESIQKQNTCYSGGVDEIRENDPESIDVE